MRWLDRVMQENRYSLFWMPFGMVAVFGTILIGCLFWLDAPYKVRTLACVILTLLGWGVLLLRNQRRGFSDAKNARSFVCIRMPVYLGFAVITAWFMACTVWQSYLSLNPAWSMNNGTLNQDTLFFATIAEGYRQADGAILLVAEEPHIKYHTFSIYIVHLLGRVTGIPALFVYNYLFPLLFFPLCTYLLLKTVSELKLLFVNNKILSCIDVAMTSFMIVGFLPYKTRLSIAIWKSSVYISQSFLLAVILSLIFFILAVKIIRSRNLKLQKLFCIAVVPLFIILISASKITVGFIMTGAICYYLLRMRKMGSPAWWMAFFYAGLFFVCLKAFASGSGSVGSFWKIFAFQRYCKGWIGYVGHYLYLLAPISLFSIGLILQGKCRLSNFHNRETIWLEILGVITVLGVFPDVFLALPGGATAYFSLFAEFPGVVFLCANNFFVRDIKYVKWRWLGNVLLFWCFVLLITNKSLLPVRQEMMQDSHLSNIYGEMEEIRRMVDGRENEYVIFLEKDATITKVYKNPHAKVFVYPALTGCNVINGAYYKDGKTYNFVDEQVPYYGMQELKQEKLTLPQAIENARMKGKRYLIDISSAGYNVITLQESS